MNIKNLLDKYDTNNMHDSIKSFPEQFDLSIDLMKSWNSNFEYNNINKILILGMGGSAIGGEIVADMLRFSITIPIRINRGYSIPNWVDKNTLIIASSYSGNTEETLSSFEECRNKFPTIVISTGGKLLNAAIKDGIDYIILPSGEQPRAALGYSISTYILLFLKIELINQDILQKFNNAIIGLKEFSNNIMSDNSYVIDIAEKIYNKIPIIYSENELTSSIGKRFSNQLQENSKILSYTSVLPEINHNEIEGWCSDKMVINKIFIIWLAGYQENSQNINRRKITIDLISSFTKNQHEINISGSSEIEFMLKLVHFNDWVSFYAAMFNEVNPTPVKQISFLKERLASL